MWPKKIFPQHSLLTQPLDNNGERKQFADQEVERGRGRRKLWSSEKMMSDHQMFKNGSFLDSQRLLFSRFWTWGILGTQTRRRGHKACPGEVNISGAKNNMLFSIIQIIIWKIWSVKHISFPARCGHLKRPRSRAAGEHLKLQVANKLIVKGKEYETQLSKVQDHALSVFQTSSRDDPAKKAQVQDIRKSSRLKNQPCPRPVGLAGSLESGPS